MTNILRKPAVQKKVGMGRSQLDEAIRKGLFPAGFPIIEGGRALGWLDTVVDQYIEDRSKLAAEPRKVLTQPPQLREAQERRPKRSAKRAATRARR
jgi:predicted DNA-binding transcriptional regulator AlpA